MIKQLIKYLWNQSLMAVRPKMVHIVDIQSVLDNADKLELTGRIKTLAVGQGETLSIKKDGLTGGSIGLVEFGPARIIIVKEG